MSIIPNDIEPISFFLMNKETIPLFLKIESVNELIFFRKRTCRYLYYDTVNFFSYLHWMFYLFLGHCETRLICMLEGMFFSNTSSTECNHYSLVFSCCYLESILSLLAYIMKGRCVFESEFRGMGQRKTNTIIFINFYTFRCRYLLLSYNIIFFIQTKYFLLQK